MADETVVREPLLDAKIASGRRLVELLDLEKFEIVAALWLYTSSADEWRLMLATPLVDSDGPRSVYLKIRAILDQRADELPWLNLSNITVISPEDPLVKSLRSAIKTVGGLQSIRFTRNRINDLFIEDALIYRAA
jgi:hypothetical protein